MTPFYSLLGTLAIASSLLINHSIHKPPVGEAFVYYDAAVKHAAVPPPWVQSNLIDQAHVTYLLQSIEPPPITPTPEPPPPVKPPTSQPTVRAQGGNSTGIPANSLVRADVTAAIAAHFPEYVTKATRMVGCESTWRPETNTGNGYYGMWQFDLQTWQSVGGTGLPSNASADEQTYRARLLYERRGWQPWGCQ